MIAIVLGVIVITLVGAANLFVLMLPLRLVAWLIDWSKVIYGRLGFPHVASARVRMVIQLVSLLIIAFACARVQVWLWNLEPGLDWQRWTMAVASVCIGLASGIWRLGLHSDFQIPTLFGEYRSARGGLASLPSKGDRIWMCMLSATYASIMLCAYATCAGYGALHWLEREVLRSL